MPATARFVLVAVIVIVGWAALLTACSSDPPARLPDGVTAAIVYNEDAERWHAGAILHGDRPNSSLRVLCLTEAGKPWADSGREHAGINIDAAPGDAEGNEGDERSWSASSDSSASSGNEGIWGYNWGWRIDGRPWEGGRWSLDANTHPARVVAVDVETESEFFQELRNADSAALIGSKDGDERLAVRFDLAPLFDTPAQFAIDACDQDSIEQRTGGYHSAYAYWIPNSERHSISLTVRNPESGHSLLLSCGPTAFTDDDAPAWIRQSTGDIYAVVTLWLSTDEASHAHDQSERLAVSSAVLNWSDEHGNSGTANWDVQRNWLYAPSAVENLLVIDSLRESQKFTITIESADAEPATLILNGAALFSKPMGDELDACIREYADLNG